MRKLKYLLPILLVAAASCKKEPTFWNSDWSAPLISDTLSLENLVNDSTLTTAGGYYVMDLKRSLFDLNINDLVQIPDTTINTDYSIAFAFINVPPGYAFVNEAENFNLGVADIELKEVILKKGFIDVEVRNPAGTKAFFNVDLPGVSKQGQAFNETYVADAGSNSNPGVIKRTVNLSGYKLDLTGANGAMRNTLRADITVTSDPAGPTVVMSNTDIVKIKVTLREVEVNYAKGYFGERVISDTAEVNLDIMNLVQSGSIDLPASTVKFELENGVKVSATGLLTTVSSTNTVGNTINLTHPQLGSTFNVNPAVGNWATLTPSVKTIEFNQGNSNVEGFLENLGNKYKLGYKVQLNPWGNVSGGTDEIYPQSRLKVNLRATMPLTIGLNDLVVRDTFDIQLEQNTAKTHVVSGELKLRASNAFPFSADAKLILLNKKKQIVGALTGSSIIQASQFGAFDAGHNLNVANSEVSFVLSEALLEKINDIKYVIVESEFDSMDVSTNLNQPMSIPEGAFLAVKLKASFKTENRL